MDAFGVEPVDRLVEQQDLRVAEQGGGDAEPLRHAEGEPAGALPRDLAEPDHVEDLVDAADRDPVGPGEPAQVGVRGNGSGAPTWRR
ncbi:hypothetical protein GCM10020366_09970 [Saccharopolyspora gregorii]|uniref:Uncharacterized protein n=1 Tax=Saccharopolyspora gregorii TaxID=33914 RepID=A0ABP6RKQ1_9PSEU